MPESVKEVAQVVATPLALELIERVRARHGALMFYQSGGCCDGSAPMCWAEGELLVGDHDRLLGHIGGAPFYISDAQFAYWSHTQLIIDAEAGRGGMFSLESTLGLRFVTRSRLYGEAEWRWLRESGKV